MKRESLSLTVSGEPLRNPILDPRREDGGGVGRGEHFLPHKFIKRTFKR